MYTVRDLKEAFYASRELNLNRKTKAYCHPKFNEFEDWYKTRKEFFKKRAQDKIIKEQVTSSGYRRL